MDNIPIKQSSGGIHNLTGSEKDEISKAITQAGNDPVERFNVLIKTMTDVLNRNYDNEHPEPKVMLPMFEMSSVDKQKDSDEKYIKEIATPRFIVEHGREPHNIDEVLAHNRAYAEKMIEKCK